MRRFGITMVVVTLLVTPVAWSGSLAGVKMADTATVGDSTLHLNGMGVRSKLWIKVYVAGLYVAEKGANPNSLVKAESPKRIVMHFLTNKATKKKMDAAWQEGFKANSPAEYGKLEKRVKKFMNLFGDMKDGDKIGLSMVPGKGTLVDLNGKNLGTIEGDDFSKALLLVWLGKEPPTEDLQTGMLGK